MYSKYIPMPDKNGYIVRPLDYIWALMERTKLINKEELFSQLKQTIGKRTTNQGQDKANGQNPVTGNRQVNNGGLEGNGGEIGRKNAQAS